jgi:hypothetical protein
MCSQWPSFSPVLPESPLGSCRTAPDMRTMTITSTFPRMTTGTTLGILQSIHVVSITPRWVRKGRNYERAITLSRSESGRGEVLCLLWRTPPGHAQLETDLVSGVSAAGRHEHRCEPVCSLSPTPHSPSHRRRGPRSHLGGSGATGRSHGPLSNPGTEDNRAGRRQASSLTCPSRPARADGRRDDL